MQRTGTPPPRTVIGPRHERAGAETVGCSVTALLQCAGRRTTPSGTTPARTRCHKAMSSLRAKATIIFLREVRAFLVRASNHFAKALSFWNLRKRHASWIIPFRTRALPDRESPYGQNIGTAEEPVLHRAIELAGAQSWGDGYQSGFRDFLDLPIASRRIGVAGFESLGVRSRRL